MKFVPKTSFTITLFPLMTFPFQFYLQATLISNSTVDSSQLSLCYFDAIGFG
jgi:hypothetical protein